MKKISSLALLALTALVLAQSEDSGQTATAAPEFSKIWTVPINFAYYGAGAVVCWLFGWMIFAALQKRQYPSSAARFGFFWGTLLFLVLFAAFVKFKLLVLLPNWILVLLLLLLIVWFFLIYQKKR